MENVEQKQVLECLSFSEIFTFLAVCLDLYQFVIALTHRGKIKKLTTQ